MKRKINLRFLFITGMAIIFTTVLSAFVYYDIFKQEVIEELKTYAHILVVTDSYIDLEESLSTKSSDMDNLRITLVNSKGEVEFDSFANVSNMDNHSNRPEIVSARECGEGESVRKSQTLSNSTFYYAIKLNNNKIIRVSKEADSIFSIFISSFPIICIVMIILFAVCIIISNLLTKSLLAPIKQMASNLDTNINIPAYKELIPFIETIRKQHNDIMKNAKMRQEFTANISHELKTPLTSISGYSELIETGMANSDDVIRFAGEIHKNSNRLLTLINDIIRLSELDTVDRDIVYEKVNIYGIAYTCVEMLKINAENQDVTLRFSGSDEYIMGNKEMLEELVFNLCDNAIRYNNKFGSVIVSIYEENEKVVLSVKDTGIGISKENQNRIFERFYRVDKSRSKSTGGTGLGLAIVKHIIAGHKNASIEVESEIGMGTEIKVLFEKI